ncbi:hypothetical protein ACWCPL_19185, partial [Streptomyces sp. NPDC001948]
RPTVESSSSPRTDQRAAKPTVTPSTPSVRASYSDAIHHTQDGIPYLAPELVLLFKAKHARRKDQTDFDATVPHMTPAQRETLAGLLARVHPGHPWLTDL